MEGRTKNLRVAVLGNHLPRKCGIATFTHDVTVALQQAGVEVDVIAMNKRPGLEYPAVVKRVIEQEDVESYRAAARQLNAGGYDLLLVEHEFGIFGGEAGSHLLELLRSVNIPVITTLHTVLQKPSGRQRQVLEEVIQHSQQLIVMSEKAKSLLQDVHGVEPSQITLIPHGIPDLPDISVDAIKAEYGLSHQSVVLTFGLISPNKGIDHAIRAMAEVPDAVYIIAGQTHPEVAHEAGEVYRESLEALVAELGLEDRVRFINRFVDDAELGRLLKMADVYVCPYLFLEQITSGTLAYSVGNGKAVVSTPFWHAAELLEGGRGVLVKPGNAPEMAAAINEVLQNPAFRNQIEQKALEYGKQTRWPEIGKLMVRCFEASLVEIDTILKGARPTITQTMKRDLPPLRLDHLRRLTDDTGLYQHATYTFPNRTEGYCIDDNIRGLLLTLYLEKLGTPEPELQARYLSFCADALNPANGKFRNFMSFDRKWLEEEGSEDSQARTIWGLGTASTMAQDPDVRRYCAHLVAKTMMNTVNFTHVHSCAYATLGLLEAGEKSAARVLVQRLVEAKEKHRSENWPWFSDCVTYASARIPQALMLAGWHFNDRSLMASGLESLSWLDEVQTVSGYFHPIGNRGFFPKGGKPARWDAQPIEAWAQLSACSTAWRVTGEATWLRSAQRAFNWFLGENAAGLVVANLETGGCGDGLEPSSVNENQGAESTLAYLCSLTELKLGTRLSSPRGYVA